MAGRQACNSELERLESPLAPALAIVTAEAVVATVRHGPSHPGPDETTCSPPERDTWSAAADTDRPPDHVATSRPPPSADATALWPSKPVKCTVTSGSGAVNRPRRVPP